MFQEYSAQSVAVISNWSRSAVRSLVAGKKGCFDFKCMPLCGAGDLAEEKGVLGPRLCRLRRVLRVCGEAHLARFLRELLVLHWCRTQVSSHSA